MTEVDWVSPPSTRAGRGVVYFNQAVREQLRNQPLRWARIATGRKSANAALVRRHPAFEFTTRSVRGEDDSLTYDIYARYVGEETS